MGRKRKRRWESNLSDEEATKFAQIAEELFDKKFCLKTEGEEYKLPADDAVFHEKAEGFEGLTARGNELKCEGNGFEALQGLKARLNEVKGQLSGLDILEWNKHTGGVNPAGLVVSQLRATVNPELCTQAWAKFHEILCSYDIIPHDALQAAYLHSVHLCEAPGAFVTSLNHHLATKLPWLHWDWCATTLNPYYEGNAVTAMIDSDAFIVGSLESWDFGTDWTGDLMKWENVQHLQERCKDSGPVHLVTADGSFDCANQPGEQEAIVFPLIFCEVVAALHLLDEGGSFVLKLFTMFEHCTVSLLYLLSCCFKEIHIIKPGTSKAGNSEVYVVCLKYSKEVLSETFLNKLSTDYNNLSSNHVIFPQQNIPEHFINKVHMCAEFFYMHQVNAINGNLQLYQSAGQSTYREITLLRENIAKNFIERFGVQPLKGSDWWVDSGEYRAHERLLKQGQGARLHSRSYTERMVRGSKTWLENILQENETEEKTSQEEGAAAVSGSEEICWIKDNGYSNEDLAEFEPILGKPVDRIRNSRLCSREILERISNAVEHAEIMKAVNVETLCTLENLLKVQKKTEPCVTAKATCFPEESGGKNACIIEEEKCSGVEERITQGSCTEVDDTVHRESSSTHKRYSGCCSDSGTLQQHSMSSESICLKEIFEQVGITCDGIAVDFSACKSLDSLSEHAMMDKRLPQVKTFDGTFDSNSADVEEVIKNIQRDTEKSKVCLVFSSLVKRSQDNLLLGQAELESQTYLVNFLVCSLRMLNVNGVLLVHMNETLTLFSAGVLYVLNLMFDKLTIIKPASSPAYDSSRFLVCMGYRGPQHTGLSNLKRVRSLIRTSHDRMVLQVVPVSVLYQSELFRFLKSLNEQLFLQQEKEIIQLEILYQKEKNKTTN